MEPLLTESPDGRHDLLTTEVSRKRCRGWRTYRPGRSMYIVSVLIVAIVSFLLGGHHASKTSKDTSLSFPLQPLTPWMYNRTFGDTPSASSDAAWTSVFPRAGGFFMHPDLAPERSTLAVFHQLHCLDGMRRAIWRSLGTNSHQDATHDNMHPTVRDDSNHGGHQIHATDPRHMRHCIDLIRHTLMCRPDLTVEVVDRKLGGVTGFGTPHSCIDWQTLLDWVSEWQGWKPLS